MRTSSIGTRLGQIVLLAVSVLAMTQSTLAAERSGRQIEEVIVTAERKEASVQDTSISITAFTGDFLEDFGMRNQSDLQNYVPATTIQPYDATVRGVGRNFRALGGDPGVSTYMNGVYSEDLYTATVGIGFFDVERIEILRGPQGTLYGRNAIGGAMNIIYNKPEDDFGGKVQVIGGDYGTAEMKAVLTGPISDTLSYRFSMAKRERDGIIEEKGFGDDIDSLDEDGVALQLRWAPTDTLEINLRANDSNVDRIMGGANSAVGVVFTEEGDQTRNTTSQVFGWRPVDPAQTTNFLATDYYLAGAEEQTFVDPITGTSVLAQRVRPGIDPVGIAGGVKYTNHFPGRANVGFNAPDASDCMTGLDPDIDGQDACTYTNGHNMERFEQSGTQLSVDWDISADFSLKYIFGYNDLFYDRINDEDMTSSLYNDRQFYVNHEAEYYSHEMVAYWSLNEDVSFTSGIFYYNAKIDQRGDIYNSVATDSNISVEDQRYTTDGNDLGFLHGIFSTFLPNWNTNGVTLYSARDAANSSDAPLDTVVAAFGPYIGDTNSGMFDVDHGPATAASDLLYHTRSEREAYAAYTQGVWDINQDFTLTFGFRWARDNLYGMENVYRYTEGNFGLLPTDPTAGPIPGFSLAAYNILIGALDPVTLQPTGAVPVRYHGLPLSLSAFREQDRSDTQVTGRLNLDYNLDDNQMMYFSVTSGYRAGGYNLVFFSETSNYDPEELIAYEIGYKGQLAEGTVQLNASAYYYDYSNIHTFGTEASGVGGTTTSVLEAPGAEIFGIEAELLWLATDQLTLGGNFSYTPSEYTESLMLSDETDSRHPASLFNPLTTSQKDIKGNQLLQVAEGKATVWGTYDIPLDSGSLQILGSFSWIDDVYYDPHESPVTMAPAYSRLDARVTWKNIAQDLVVSAFVNNITDESGIRFISRDDETNGFLQGGQLSEPRLWGVEVTYHFGASSQ